MGGLGDGPVLEVGVIDELPLDDPAAACPADDLQRVVGREGIGHENLVGHLADRFDARADLVRLVLAGRSGR